MKLRLKSVDLACEYFESGVFDHADFAVFECDGADDVLPRADAVQPQQLAGHLESGDLLPAILEHDGGLERTGADGIERLKRHTRLVEGLMAPQLAARANELFDAGDVFFAQPDRQAQFHQVALGASHAQLAQSGRKLEVHCASLGEKETFSLMTVNLSSAVSCHIMRI